MASVNPNELNELKEQIIDLYGSKVEESGATLEINPILISSNAGAYSKKIKAERKWEITIYGGMIQHPLMSQAALGLIICHEIGHFLGGKPYVKGKKLGPILSTTAPKEMSAEGQADFFATAECGKKLFARLNLPPAHLSLPSSLVDACIKSGTSEKVCNSLVETAKLVSDIYVDLSSKIDRIQYDPTYYLEKDNTQVPQTLLHVGEYPGLQCRLDTMLAGLSCRLNSSGVCYVGESSEVVELRPACWYHP
jgi:hypothetical protein